MGCSSCGTPVNNFAIEKIAKRVRDESCEYTVETLSDWLITLNYVKGNGLYNNLNLSLQKINSYLGIIQSSVNYSTNPCYFKIKLDEMVAVIAYIKNTLGI